MLVISEYYKQKGGYSSKLASPTVQMNDFSRLHTWCRMTLVEVLVSTEFDGGLLKEAGGSPGTLGPVVQHGGCRCCPEGTCASQET